MPVRLLQAVGREPARGPAPGGGHHAPLHRRPLLPRRGGPPAARRSRADPRARAPVSVRSRDGQPPPRATGEELVTVESTRNEGLASSTTGFPPLRWVFCGTRRPPPRQRRLPLGPGSRPRAPLFHGGWYLSTHCSRRCVARSPLTRGTELRLSLLTDCLFVERRRANGARHAGRRSPRLDILLPLGARRADLALALGLVPLAGVHAGVAEGALAGGLVACGLSNGGVSGRGQGTEGRDVQSACPGGMPLAGRVPVRLLHSFFHCLQRLVTPFSIICWGGGLRQSPAACAACRVVYARICPSSS